MLPVATFTRVSVANNTASMYASIFTNWQNVCKYFSQIGNLAPWDKALSDLR